MESVNGYVGPHEGAGVYDVWSGKCVSLSLSLLFDNWKFSCYSWHSEYVVMCMWGIWVWYAWMRWGEVCSLMGACLPTSLLPVVLFVNFRRLVGQNRRFLSAAERLYSVWMGMAVFNGHYRRIVISCALLVLVRGYRSVLRLVGRQFVRSIAFYLSPYIF